MEDHQRAHIDKLSQHYRTSFKPAAEDGLARLHMRMQSQSVATPTKKPTSGFWKLAATLALILSIVAVWKFGFSDLSNAYATTDFTKTVQLPDGSTVLLNHETTLVLSEDFNEEKRAVQLSGEAFFQIEPDPLRPFIIDHEDAMVSVLGTAFNLSQDEKGFIVEVSEGRVELSHKDESISLGPKQCGMVRNGQISTMDAPHLNRHAWRTGRLIFEDTPFDQVILSVAETFRMSWEMDIDDENSCSKLLFNGQFESVSLSEILTAIERHFGLEIKPLEGRENTYRISGDCR